MKFSTAVAFTLGIWFMCAVALLDLHYKSKPIAQLYFNEAGVPRCEIRSTGDRARVDG
jgi:hypothetical protein